MDGLLEIVIIAKENTSLRLKKLLECLLNQTYRDIKITVADINISNSDYSFGLLEDLEMYPDVAYIKMKESMSIPAVYNYFLDNSDSLYICFLGSNDLWDYETAASMIVKFGKGKKVGGVFCDGIKIMKDDTFIIPEPFFRKEKLSFLGRLLSLQVKNSVQVIYDVKALKKIKGFNEEYNILYHTDALLRLSKDYTIIALPKKLSGAFIIQDKSYQGELMDYKKLHLDHIDIFLWIKQANEYYYRRIIKLAFKSRLWLSYLLYLLIYFLKYPAKSVQHILRLINKGLNKIYRKAIGYLSVIINIIESTYYKKRLIQGKAKRKSDSTSKNLKGVKPSTLRIPPEMTIIERGQFFNKQNIEAVEIPSTVLEIKSHAFSNCGNLKEVIIHEQGQLKTIGSYAFANCEKLKKVNINTSLQTIKPYAFLACGKLENIECSEESILEGIGKGAFLGCAALESLFFTGPIKNIASYVFAGCYNLKSVIFPKIDGLEHIGKGAFIHCKSLEYFQLSMRMEAIREKTFYGCTSIKKITIPKSVVFIEKESFIKCNSLQLVSILNKDIIIAANVFDKHTKVEKADI